MSITPERELTLAALADAVLARAATGLGHPLRVGIDGPDGSGKTTLRAELAAVLREAPAAAGTEVIEASVDDFHHAREVRYAMGRHSWEGYWAGAFDYPRLVSDLLEPLGPRGTTRYRVASHDLEADVPVDAPWHVASPSAILLLDGVLLQRRELVGHLDMVIYVDVPFQETYRRMAIRDGFPADPEAPTNLRYTETQRHYQRTCDPRGRADVVVDNVVPAAASIARV